MASNLYDYYIIVCCRSVQIIDFINTNHYAMKSCFDLLQLDLEIISLDFVRLVRTDDVYVSRPVVHTPSRDVST